MKRERKKGTVGISIDALDKLAAAREKVIIVKDIFQGGDMRPLSDKGRDGLAFILDEVAEAMELETTEKAS